MKTPDETKKQLEEIIAKAVDRKLHAWRKGIEYDYFEDVAADALALIKQLEATVSEKENVVAELSGKIEQLEAERDALMHWAKGRCDTCAHKDDCVKHDPDPDGYVIRWYDDCEIWEWRGVQKEE